MKVGDTIWIRVEREGFFHEHEIIGETSRSWSVLPTGDADKSWMIRYANKLPKSGKGWIVATPKEAKLSNWLINNRYTMQTMLKEVQDASVLLKIAQLLGMKGIPGLEAEPCQNQAV